MAACPNMFIRALAQHDRGHRYSCGRGGDLGWLNRGDAALRLENVLIVEFGLIVHGIPAELLLGPVRERLRVHEPEAIRFAPGETGRAGSTAAARERFRGHVGPPSHS